MTRIRVLRTVLPPGAHVRSPAPTSAGEARSMRASRPSALTVRCAFLTGPTPSLDRRTRSPVSKGPASPKL